MGIKHDTEESLKAFEFTKIDGQPTSEDLILFKEEMIDAATSISTTNGGGQFGHAGMIMKEIEYLQLSNGERFLEPINPGPYPVNVDPDPIIRERQVAEHKAEKEEFEKHQAVKQFLIKTITRVVDPEWLEPLKHADGRGFNGLHPRDILDHLQLHGGNIDYLDVTKLTQQMQTPWDQVEAPATFFARGDKIERQLVKAGQLPNPSLRLAFALTTFETSGEFDPSIREWKAKPTAEQTFPAFRTFIQKAFTDRTKHNKTTAKTAGHGIANSATDATIDKVDEAEAAALAVAEVAMLMQSNQEKQFKQLMEFMKELMKPNAPGAPSPAPALTQPKQRKVCPHCKRPHSKPEKCWELEANAADRPAKWKPVAERQSRAQS